MGKKKKKAEELNVSLKEKEEKKTEKKTLCFTVIFLVEKSSAP